ncbi:hypothetical protein L6R52_15475, partial [Myxococcota bacterium]|nr:hypothetical protein [Myxococcota bacterium]
MPKAPAKFADPIEELKERGPRPLYMVDGEERLLVDEAVRTIKQYALPKNARDFNFDTFSGQSTPLNRIVEAAEMMPAFAPRRLVLVEHADKIDLDAGDDDGKSEKKEKKRRALASFLDYLANPSPTTVLVFVAGEKKFDART